MPERSCVACRTARPKRELIRVVRATDGTISLDPTGRLPGRGAYLCRDSACWELAGRRHALDHAFKAPVPDHILAAVAADPAATGAATTDSTPGAMSAPTDNDEGGPHGSK